MFTIFNLETYGVCEFDGMQLVDNETGEVYFTTEQTDEIEAFYELFCFLRERKNEFDMKLI